MTDRDEPNEYTFPERAAKRVALTNGDVVMVRVLSQFHRDEADRRARRWAVVEAERVREGGDEFEAVCVEVGRLTDEQQATLICGAEYWAIREAAETAYPDVAVPAQGAMSSADFASAMGVYRRNVQQARSRRERLIEERFEKSRLEALALTRDERERRATIACHAHEFARAYERRMRVETLFRAVRVVDNPTRRYFRDLADVEDADEAVIDALETAYRELDVPFEAVPTSPVS